MAALTLTGANSIITLAIPGLYPVPQALQGYETDDVSKIAPMKTSEVKTGVDGNLSVGYIYVPVVQTINLQGDSASCTLFDNWFMAQNAINEVYTAIGVIHLPSVQKSYILTKGVLTSYKPMSDVKKMLEGREFEITWQDISVAPL